MRYQVGTVIERSRKLYLRYSLDGQKHTEWIADVDHEHWIQKRKRKPTQLSDAVRATRDTRMAEVNRSLGTVRRGAESMTIAEFWNDVFAPSMRDRKLSEKTVAGYNKTWRLYLKDEIGSEKVTRYRTEQATELLSRLVKKRDLNVNTLAHVRTCMSSIFTQAAARGLIRQGQHPIAHAKSLVKARPQTAKELRPRYTLDEVRTVLQRTDTRLEARLVLAISFFLGPRPDEIAHLRWENVRNEFLLVRDTKHGQDVWRRLLAIEPVRSLLIEWHERNGSPREGWIFPNQRGDAMSSGSFQRNVLKPVVEACGIEWKSLYAGRRGTGTVLRDLTNALVAAQQVLGHRTLNVTDAHYALPSTEKADEGLRLLEAAYRKSVDDQRT